MMSFVEARKIMGEANQKYTDSQIQEMIDVLSAIINISIDSYIVMKRKRTEVSQEWKTTHQLLSK